ncbi:hypothetical protein [Fontibacter flavus]|uniref:Uncharacterized protein n=1 Tax=Fontibacter flavus TaxID=654838 RepID=A0ABV6FUI3_9BACT
MAKQTSIITLNGKVGALSFYKTKDGYFAREKGGVSRSRIMSDPRFARTRENIREFTENTRTTKLFLDTIRPATLKIADPKIYQRMVTLMMRILKSDPVNSRGDRKVSEGDWNMLQGFELNGRAGLSSTLRAEYAQVNTATEWGVSIPSFLPADFLIVPEGSTHFRIFIAGVSVNIATGERSLEMSSTEELPVNSASGQIDLSIQKDVLGEQHKAYFMGVEFAQLVNGQHYNINNGIHNAAAIIMTENT